MIKCKICDAEINQICITNQEKAWHRYSLTFYQESLALKDKTRKEYCLVQIINYINANNSSIELSDSEEYIGKFSLDHLIDIRADFNYYLNMFENLRFLK